MTRLTMAGLLAVAEIARAAAPSVSKDPRDVPPPISRNHPETVTIDLVAREVVGELAPDRRYWFWTFAEKRDGVVGPGTVPGPMIRVREGDTVVVNLTNEPGGIEPHNLDFHAGIGAMLEDVAPGETKTLQFKATREGGYIYHCGAEGMPWEHVAHGMYGLMMVEPRGGLRAVDHEFYLGQGEWYPGPNVEHPEVDADSLDEDKALAEHPDYVTFNGHTKALTDPAIFGDAVTVARGDSVRMFLVSGGPNLGSNFHVIGQIFDRVLTGHHLTAMRNEETVYVPPGSAAVFEFQAQATGDFPIVDHALFRVPKGAAGLLHVR
ncbi:MAG: multicopper oxidase domain-containing protein [Candidatus Binatia bacterium]